MAANDAGAAPAAPDSDGTIAFFCTACGGSCDAADATESEWARAEAGTPCHDECIVPAAALRYAARGWRVLPLRGKVPLAGSNGCHGATTDRGAISDWPPGVNVGIATGHGFVVLDVDPRHGGIDALEELERRYGELPATAAVESGGDGWHYYFAAAGLGCSKLFPGLDLKGAGGYVVAPPSVHPLTGCAYRWEDKREPVPLPAWLERLLRDRQNGRARPASEWHELARDGVSEGERNIACARLAGHLLGRGVDSHVALELVRAWNATRNRPPLADAEVIRAVESIAARELGKWGS
jgi:hypothetical protein